MSINRFSIVYLPFSKLKKFPFTNIGIVLCALIAMIPIFLTSITNCYLVYEPKEFAFIPARLEECGATMDRVAFLVIGILALLANSFNVLVVAKLLKDKMTGISEDQRNKRRKKWKSMYIQSVIQDFIQLFDITNYNITSRIFNTPLWLFLFGPLSFSLVYTLDGLVMLLFHSNSFCMGKTSPSQPKVIGVQSSKSEFTISNIVVVN